MFMTSWSDMRAVLWDLFPQTLLFDKLTGVGVRSLGQTWQFKDCVLKPHSLVNAR